MVSRGTGVGVEALGFDAEGQEFESQFGHFWTGKNTSVNPTENGYFFESGKDKAAQGEGWAPPFICCAKDTVGL